MTQCRRSQSIVLLLTVVLSAVFLWALAAMVQPPPIVHADSPPQIETITVTSSQGTYFYSPVLGQEGGEVYFNSVGGEGAGQVLTVTVTVTGTMPITLTGAPAFGDIPPPDNEEPWEITYTVEISAGTQSGIVFTATNASGFDTAVITFTQDNVDPTVELTDVTNPGHDFGGDELDDNGSNWYNAGDFIGTRWYFTSTTSDVGAAGLASGTAFWDHSSGATYDQAKNCGSDGSDFFPGVITNTDGLVTVTVTISDRVGNSANDLVVFNIDNTSPAISSPSINEYNSPYLHVPGSTAIYYGDGMGTSPQPFDVEGLAQDDGVGLDKATYSTDFDTTPSPDDLSAPPSGWRFWSGRYTADEKDYSYGFIDVTVSDLLGNIANRSFFYDRDVAHPTVWFTDVTDPDYDPDGNELNTTGNWYRTGGLAPSWAFTSTTNDSGAGLPSSTDSGTAFWDHSNGTAQDQTIFCGSGGDGAFTGVSDDGSGTVTVTVTITDNVANATTSVPLVIRLDDTAPSVPGSFAYQNDSDSGGDGIAPLSGYDDDTEIELQWDASSDGSGSGLLTPPYHLGTASQPPGGPYPEDSSYIVSGDGIYTIYLTAEDNVGNISNDTTTGPVTVDTGLPLVNNINCPSGTAEHSFVVGWSATDQGPAGLRSDPYSVWYNVDGGDWQSWLTDTSATTATFGPDSPVTVEDGHTYCFRMRAVDRAGNVRYTGGNDCTEVDPAYSPFQEKVFLPIVMAPDPNWGFELGNFTSWQHGGQLAQSVSTAMPHSGSYSALLGNPGYNCYNMPVGSAWLRRSVTVPSSGSPTLSFWYRIYTQDRNSILSDEYDLFAVYINGSDVVVKDANITYPFGCGTTHDLGWKQVVFPLSAPNDYRGQTIEITFYNYNRAPSGNYPERYNTYTYVDDVSVQ